MPPQRMHAITVQQCMPSQCMPQIYSNARVFAKNQWGLGVSSSRNGVSGSRGGFFPGMVFSVPGRVFVVPTKVCLVPTVFWVPAWVFWVPTNLRLPACSGGGGGAGTGAGACAGGGSIGKGVKGREVKVVSTLHACSEHI